MRLLRPTLWMALVLGASACGNNEPAKATGPVTLKFSTPLFTATSTSARDTAFAVVTVDGTQTVNAPKDSIVGLARGDHQFEVHFDVDYLPSIFTATIDPRRSTTTLQVGQAGTCHVFAQDAQFCIENGIAKNLVYWSQHQRLICPTSDYGEFCSAYPDGLRRQGESNIPIGLNWPADSTLDSYVVQGKLMLAATVGPELGDAGRKIATGLYRFGDYSTRERLRPFASDSSRYTNVVWTDARHIPIYDNPAPTLGDADRPSSDFGLQVRTTYYQTPSYQDVLFVRFDVTNISTEADYRRVHPEVPASGFTVRDVYLAPMIDPAIGGLRGAGGVEALDDVATLFPANNLIVAYDARMNVTTFSAQYAQQPGLVGLQLIDTDVPGTPKAILASDAQILDYLDPAKELETHAVLAAGRDGAVTNCTSTAEMFNFTNEQNNDVRIAWSVGPIAALAPGQSRSVTVAVLLAHPKPGSFTTNVQLPPQNGAINDTSRPIYGVAELIRTLAAQIATQRVTP